MSINIVDARNNKRDDFEDNFEAFYQKYKECFLENCSVKTLDICGSLARKTAESFCRYMILDSRKNDSQKYELLYAKIFDKKTNKYRFEKKTLRKLIDALLKKDDPIIVEEDVRKHLRAELELILAKGNTATHDNDKEISLRDIEKIKPIILDLADYILGKRTVNLLVKELDRKFSVEVKKSLSSNNDRMVINQESSGSGDNIARDKIVGKEF
ncbi:MAG TPA: hypothetical protein ENK66_06110 [Arcobacter sp.]|nr:hypothetical protein [Arcobacter sp.]